MSHSDDITTVIDELRQFIMDDDLQVEVEKPNEDMEAAVKKQFGLGVRAHADFILTIARIPQIDRAVKLKVVCFKDRKGRFSV